MTPTELRMGSDSDSDRTSEADSHVLTDVQDERTETVVTAVDQDPSPNVRETASEDPSTGQPNRASSAGTCPSCHTQRPLRNGRIAHHKSPTMRWSGRRWFRDTCNGTGKQRTTQSASSSTQPGGGWREDFTEDHGHPDYDRPMPGAMAREVLKRHYDALMSIVERQERFADLGLAAPPAAPADGAGETRGGQ